MIVDRLKSKYKEAPASIALTKAGSVLEVLQSKDGATWTILVTHPNGVVCMVATGTDWTKVTQPVGDPA